MNDRVVLNQELIHYGMDYGNFVYNRWHYSILS